MIKLGFAEARLRERIWVPNKSEENSLLGAFRSRIEAVPDLRLSKLESRHQNGSENSLLIEVLGSESQ